MWKKPRTCRPQDRIYPDRCMLKWQGMLLSDHNERIRLDQLQEACEKPARYHTEAEREDWDVLIARSKTEGLPLTLIISRPNEPEMTRQGIVQLIRPTRLVLMTEQGPLTVARHEIDGVF
ncbi:hypothetical protein [Proteiniclasticum sp. QWL-01]|uniref:hypothetical protein n=1 Tax=Proteiniclasticum sp. QWL-01 TaxID=3036945 RepID=UPI00220A46B0|nr:hypothetical protein [Proteiniclasticum sp. QWL-01]UUM13038.1 hypothetical protein NQU17_05605 [Clostridiaceae bacterium HFYG-1003]WFF71463.1 hypothetical protein P6M73_09050 [Proteiniclasticum sp. QWL-01]